ncbi:DUF5666 domain-containing protein [Nocardia sp. CDC153]|uniref:DUF5666 domain-containing protein n=1 Tax=Nocardia sp. CDC153 TaxID=3112167 RepID=UPI002DBC0631|nr:DUF5666 domain-containing protein [Nocardia sp. CDC153]MEC3955129.1 DUF5666 domain-containing protein [Nocardia sp. CDC153]
MTDSIPAADGSQPSRGRRRPGRLTLALVGSALGIAATLGLVACGSSSEHAAKGDQEQGPGGHRADGARGVGGTITTEGSGSWMITKRDGRTETVTISPTTEFGTKAKSETAAQFAVGDQIMVQGQESNGTITATRILHARDHTKPDATQPNSANGTPPASPSATPPTK